MFIALSFRPTQNENYHVYKWFGLSLGKSNDIMILGSLKPILQQLVFFDYWGNFWPKPINYLMKLNEFFDVQYVTQVFLCIDVKKMDWWIYTH